MEEPNSDAANGMAAVSGQNNAGESDSYKRRFDVMSFKVGVLERKMEDLQRWDITTRRKLARATKSKGSSSVKDKPKDKPIPEGLGLDDYYEVIDKPMDFSTIKNQMEAVDGTGYKNVRQICADVRLVFKNAMKYNDEKSDVYDMAKTLLTKFEEKWLQFLPKVMEEEKRRQAEMAEAKALEKLAHEAAYAKLARDVSHELTEIDSHLEELRQMVVLKCRKFSVEEKRRLGAALARMSPENLTRALEIVAEADPTFKPAAEVVNLDIDAQSESTLWRLKFFVNDNEEEEEEEEEEEDQGNDSVGGDDNNRMKNLINYNNNNNKRRREISNAIAKAAKKKRQKPNF
ncbi:hypothetical protein TIFTF001_042891 [Ficus carica]|uniref:Uncharacterized protein n=1 Tax=Ficus carica TaxID=3494 RepID=A0AA87YPA7_FICCA|nr:hypothetical protein TIFTF001_042891 [Ficus carica]